MNILQCFRAKRNVLLNVFKWDLEDNFKEPSIIYAEGGIKPYEGEEGIKDSK